jgi:hypothetical protein
VLLMWSALVLGFLHGLGADHLMAIAALSGGPTRETAAVQRTRAVAVAMRFAVGHALLLAVGAGLLITLGWSLPLVFERAGEMLGGALLVLFGFAGLAALVTGRIYAHTHHHGGEPAAHWHLHLGRRDHHPSPSAHSHLPTIIGAAFAISSLRALTMLAPFGERMDAAPLPVLLGLIALFGVGILVSMSLFGVAFAQVISTRTLQRISTLANAGMAVACIGLGIFWIAAA